jgi:hypothetical protein
MVAAPSELLGLPPAFAGRGVDVALLRYVLLGLVAAWCWALARSRRRLALVLGVACVTLATGFWVLALGRPWGVLVDAGATRAAAQVAVSDLAPEAGGFVVGAAPATPFRRGLLALGLPGNAVQVLPSLLPIVVLPALGLAVALLWRDRDRAALGASLVLVASTGELGAARGWALLPGIWPHPFAAAVLPLVLAAVLALARLPGRLVAQLSAMAVLVLGLARPAGEGLPVADAILALTLEQGLWLPLAVLGLRAQWDVAPRTLVGGGAGMVLLAGLGLPLDSWGAMALYRVGLVLAGTTALWAAAPAIGNAALRAAPWLPAGLEPRWLAAGLVLAVAAPGSVVVWWDPLNSDRVASASVEPLSAALQPSFEWIRENTSGDAVFMASPAYSAALGVRTGRRVLRAPELLRTADDAERVRAERLLLARRPLPGWVRRYGVGWVFVAPGDFEARGIEAPEQLVGAPGLSLRYRDEARFFIFEVVPEPR